MRSVMTGVALVLVLSPARMSGAQDRNADYAGELRSGNTYLQRNQYDQALQAYKRAFEVSGKTSFDALAGVALAYRGLGAYKDMLDSCNVGLKLAGDDKSHQAQMHNLRGSALAALSEKPGDKKLKDAEVEFRAALAANESLVIAHENLGVVLLKMHRDEEGVRELRAYVENAREGPVADDARRSIENPRRAREAFAPEFSFTTREGESISLEQLKGKTVLLDFWGSWCTPCVEARPGLVRLRQRLSGQPVAFVGIAHDEKAQWTRYLEKNSMDWPQYLDSDERISHLFRIDGFPTYIVLDGEGIIRARTTGHGGGTDQWLEREIKKTLKNR